MGFFDWVVTVLLFIISLSFLITIHELGHFSMAKLFKVYCQEFSIGFGPKLFKRKRQNGETYFSIRAIPLGGYVAMYGEEIELEEGVVVPESRSLEGIAKWKKAIIVSAGVILNAILAFVLIFISNVAFPRIMTTRFATVTEGSVAASVIHEHDKMVCLSDQNGRDIVFSYDYTDSDKVIHAGEFFIADNNVVIDEKHYVVTYCPTGVKYATVFTEGITVYPGIAGENIATKDENENVTVLNETLYNTYSTLVFGDGKSAYFADFTQDTYKPFEGSKLNLHLLFKRYNASTQSYGEVYAFDTTVNAIQDGKTYKWDDFGLSFSTVEDDSLSFGDKLENTFSDYGYAATSVFRGLGILFTGGIKNMSGIVGIFETSATIYGSYTFATYFYFWGLISVNLAIFNLLPFPGLDGWALLVTAVEGITKKKIPSKVKGIMSIVGLALLFALMIAIVVLDIIKLV